MTFGPTDTDHTTAFRENEQDTALGDCTPENPAFPANSPTKEVTIKSVEAEQALLSNAVLITNPITEKQAEHDEEGIFLSGGGEVSRQITRDNLRSIPESASATERGLTLSDIVHSTYYAASDSVKSPTILVPADRRSLVIPTDGGIKIGDGFYKWSGIPNIDIDVAANWDDPQYADAMTRRGQNLRLYRCQHIGQTAPDFVLSANSTYPAGYSGSNSRRVATFHTLPISLGTITGHDLSGYLVGDIVPCSIADLLHRPCSAPEGMVYGVRLNGQGLPGYWIDAQLASGTGINTVSAWGATISDTRDWNSFVDDLAAVGKTLPNDAMFQIFASGSPEQVNIYGSQDPVKTGLIGTSLITGATLTGTTFSRSAWSHVAFNQEYEAEIDGNGTPDTFKWRKRTFGGAWGSYTATVPIVAGPMALADGLTVTFPATTGFTIGHKINIYCMDAPFSTAGVPMISHIGAWGMTGNLWQWLSDQSYRMDGLQSHTHTETGTTTSGPTPADPAPAWNWYALAGGKGQLYRQGTYGDVKLLAGGGWADGAGCGSQSRRATGSRWNASSYFGARGCARSRRT